MQPALKCDVILCHVHQDYSAVFTHDIFLLCARFLNWFSIYFFLHGYPRFCWCMALATKGAASMSSTNNVFYKMLFIPFTHGIG
jgi:hypothetical protein